MTGLEVLRKIKCTFWKKENCEGEKLEVIGPRRVDLRRESLGFSNLSEGIHQ